MERSSTIRSPGYCSTEGKILENLHAQSSFLEEGSPEPPRKLVSHCLQSFEPLGSLAPESLFSVSYSF